jgi:hypothetical protein
MKRLEILREVSPDEEFNTMRTVRHLITVMGLLSFLFCGCGKQPATQSPVAPAPPVLKVAVFADGRLTVDNSASTVPVLRESLRSLGEKHGAVWYYREAGQQEPPAIATEVMKAVVEARLPLRLSSRPDYSDSSIGTDTERALPQGAVSFDGSGALLAPGADWQPTDARSSLQMVCRPVLKGPDGSILKVYAPRDDVDVQSGVAILRSQAAAMPGVWQDSFKQEDFTSDSGVRGIHLSYECSDPRHPERKMESKLRTHNYVFPNRVGRCVSILYLTPADRDSDTVHQMILKTLILE